PWGIIMPYIAAVTVPGPYVVPAYSLETIVVFTNKVPTTPVRGAGRPQAVFAMERLLDRVAHELRLDRTEVRRPNSIKPEQMPFPVDLRYRDGKPLVYDSGDYPKAQQKALLLADYEAFCARVLPTSKVAVMTGATSQGQGTRTTLSQIVADQVGCHLDDI